MTAASVVSTLLIYCRRRCSIAVAVVVTVAAEDHRCARIRVKECRFGAFLYFLGINYFGAG